MKCLYVTRYHRNAFKGTRWDLSLHKNCVRQASNNPSIDRGRVSQSSTPLRKLVAINGCWVGESRFYSAGMAPSRLLTLQWVTLHPHTDSSSWTKHVEKRTWFWEEEMVEDLGRVEEESKGRWGQNTLYSCIKLSIDKIFKWEKQVGWRGRQRKRKRRVESRIHCPQKYESKGLENTGGDGC